MIRKPTSTEPPGLDPRVAGWATETLQRACAHLDEAEDLTAELTRYARELAPDQEITDPALLNQVVTACHVAIALVLVTDRRRARVLDPAEAAEAEKTNAAVAAVFATFPRQQRFGLVLDAAVKISEHTRALY